MCRRCVAARAVRVCCSPPAGARFLTFLCAPLALQVNILRELRHPFIVRYYDRIIDKAATKLYIIMEFCEGGDLGALIRRAKKEGTGMEEDFIWKVLTQMVLALKECHRHKEASGKTRPIVHRDIKPGNIFLDSAGNVKVGDFGLAKELASDTKFATTNVGTPFYMSPEMINEQKYNEKSDIWALGCLLFELAALSPPFDATNHLSLAVKINAGKFNRVPMKYSDDLHRAIRWMLQIDVSIGGEARAPAPFADTPCTLLPPQPTKRPAVEDMEKLPRVKAGMDRAQAIVASYTAALNGGRPASAATAPTAVPDAAELMRREAALMARELAVARAEASVAARLAEVGRREAACASREAGTYSRPSTAGSTGCAGFPTMQAPTLARAYSAGAEMQKAVSRPSSAGGIPTTTINLREAEPAGGAMNEDSDPVVGEGPGLPPALRARAPSAANAAAMRPAPVPAKLAALAALGGVVLGGGAPAEVAVGYTPRAL